MIPDAWLIEFNERMAKTDVAHIGRPIRALCEWAKETGYSIEFHSAEAQAVFQWFYAHSPAGYHDVLPSFVGALYYDAAFWRVEIPMCYGRNLIDRRKAVSSMPESVWVAMRKIQRDFAMFIELFADCADYAYGIAEIRVRDDGSDWWKFLISADKELRSTTQLLCVPRPNGKAIESSRMATEMALKAMLCRCLGLTAEAVRAKYNHDLSRLMKAALELPEASDFRPLRDLVDVFPSVGARYKALEYPSVQLWTTYQVAQMACTAVVRTVTGRDSRKASDILADIT